MSDDNTQDTPEPSLASAGSVANGVAVRLMAWKDERGFPTPGEMMDEAAQEIERLVKKVAALSLCEAWLQKQVADLQFAMRWNEERFQEKDAELAELRKTAAALMEIAASGADATTRRRMLDRMAMESFAENG
jgi:hypothetical protein